MANFTVTIDVADFVSDGVAPRLAYVTFSRLVVDSTTSEIVTTAPISVRVTQTPATVSLQAGVTYKVRGDGIQGVGTFYAQGTADCSLADFRDEHQVDPITQQPVDQVVTVGAAIAAAQAAAISAASTDAAAKVQAAIAGVVGDAGPLLDTLGEIQDALGDDPNLAATLAAQIAARPTAAEVSASYVTFLNSDGTPVMGKHVVIKLTPDQTDILDIQVVS